MHADELLRATRRGGEAIDADAAGVAGQDFAGRQDGIEFFEDLLLDVGFFGGGFDGDVGRRQITKSVARFNAAEGLPFGRLLDLALFDQSRKDFLDALHRFLNRTLTRIVGEHLEPILSEDLNDPSAHRSGAHNGHCIDWV